MKKQEGFSLIRVFLIIGVLILTAAGGVVGLPASWRVWEKKVTPAPSPTPSATLTPRPTLIPSVSPKVPPPVDQTFKFCEKNEDCKIIFSGCTCEATNINDPRKHLIIPGEPDCLVNDCLAPYRIEPVAACLNNQCQVKLQVPSISWEEAKQLILAGKVEQIHQFHNLTVNLLLKDGTTRTTFEPKIDAVSEVIDQCGKPCFDIIRATE